MKFFIVGVSVLLWASVSFSSNGRFIIGQDQVLNRQKSEFTLEVKVFEKEKKDDKWIFLSRLTYLDRLVSHNRTA